MFTKVFRFYYEGFKNMPLYGKQLWLIIAVKLIIMFLFLKIFFFQDHIDSKFDTEKDKIEYVVDNLTKIK